MCRNARDLSLFLPLFLARAGRQATIRPSREASESATWIISRERSVLFAARDGDLAADSRLLPTLRFALARAPLELCNRVEIGTEFWFCSLQGLRSGILSSLEIRIWVI